MLRIQTAFLFLVVTGVRVAGDDTSPNRVEIVSSEVFREMSFDEQAVFLKSTFERRLAHARNIRYEAKTVVRSHKRKGTTLGEVVWEGSRDDHRYWKLGDSYRLDSDRFGPIANTAPMQFVQSGFNATEGIGRMRVQAHNSAQIYGRIDTIHDSIVVDNRYYFWLDGDNPPHGDGEFFVRYLVEYADAYTIEFPEGEALIKVSVPWVLWISPEKPRGVRHTWLDPAKGFLPVKGKARWDWETLDPPDWRIEEFSVNDSQLVGDVWMPTSIQEIIGTKKADPVVSVYDITVLTIEHGTVDPKDLEIAFPSGTKVVDAIEGLAYTTADSGRRINVEPLMVGTAFTRTGGPRSPPTNANGRLWLIVFNLFLLAVAMLMYRRYKRKAVS